jgi:hypothetical protein
MKRVYRSEWLTDVVHWQNLLEHRGIACTVRHANLMSIVGELPWLEAWPELWVVDDRDESLARKIIAQGRDHGTGGTTPWQCGRCGERLEAQFTDCWSCGSERAAG